MESRKTIDIMTKATLITIAILPVIYILSYRKCSPEGLHFGDGFMGNRAHIQNGGASTGYCSIG
ncbi:MAG: hypothetical protein Kow0042_24600 [Calditrichia bacterium]